MSVEALIEPQAMDALAELAADIPAEQAIVEVGTHQGANLANMARAAKKGRGAKCHGVDAYGQGLVYPGRPHMLGRYTSADHRIAQRVLSTARLTNQARIIVGTSVEVASEWDNGLIGLLVIDAEHRYSQVIADHEAWAPHLVDGATIAFDDYGGSVGEEVKQAVDFLCTIGVVELVEVVGERLAITKATN